MRVVVPPGSFWTCCAGQPPRDRQNLRRFVRMYLLWALLFAGGGQLLRRELLLDGAIPWRVAALPTVVGIFALTAAAAACGRPTSSNGSFIWKRWPSASAAAGWL